MRIQKKTQNPRVNMMSLKPGLMILVWILFPYVLLQTVTLQNKVLSIYVLKVNTVG
jgi:hypothetical protein